MQEAMHRYLHTFEGSTEDLLLNNDFILMYTISKCELSH